MKTRLQDIAARAGVSVSTVSRVVNAKPGVAEATRNAVLRELEILGYEHPVSQARGRSGLVGILVPELANPVFPRFVAELEQAVVAEGYTPLICMATPVLQEDEYVNVLLDRDIDGLIFVSGRHANTEVDHGRYHELAREGLAMAFVGGTVTGLDAPFVSADEVAGVCGAVAHLWRLGHRRIGCAMGPRRYLSSQRKAEGYLQALRERGEADGPPVWSRVAHSVYSVEGGRAAADMLLGDEVTGIVCGSDLMALGAVRAVRARGLEVPRDVSVVGWDDIPLAAFTDPALTTVRQDIVGMSRRVVAALIEQISGQSTSRAELLFRTELVLRDSTAPPPSSAGSRGGGARAASS